MHVLNLALGRSHPGRPLPAPTAAELSGLLSVCRRQKADRAAQLMLAAYHCHAELVRFLVRHGADPNRLNDRQQSPLAGAVFKKEDDVIEVSRQKNASLGRVLPGYEPRWLWRDCEFFICTNCRLAPLLLKTCQQALLDGGADPDYGTPSALECVAMFKQEDRWRTRFESAPGQGKAVPSGGQ